MIFLLILKFLNFFFIITQGCSLINEFQISTLPLEQPFQVVEFSYESLSIKHQEKVEQGIWLKWQPFSHIQQILTSSIDCYNQFIYSLERKQEKRILFLLFREHNEGVDEDKFKIGLKSHYFETTEYFYFDYEGFEGVWMFFYASYNIKLQIFTFILYQSELQTLQQIQLKVSQAIIIDSLIHRVGGIKKKMIFEGRKYCFSQFQGRLSTVLLVHCEEKSFIEDFDFNLKDCSEQSINFIDDVILNGSNFLSFVTPIIEKNLFKLKGWFKMNYGQVTNEKQSLIRITSEVDENYNNFENSILLQIQLFQEEQQATIFFQSFKYDLQTKLATISKASQTDKSYFEAFKQWHFIQIDITSNKAILFLFSSHLSEQFNITLEFQSFTGIMSFIKIGGDELESQQHYFGNVYNLLFQTFCELPQKNENFIIDCHYSCQKCNGPFEDNCLSCQESNNRVLKNNKCNCAISTFEVGQSKCVDANTLFNNVSVNVQEVEMNCHKVGFDICNNEQFDIQCSFGYFQYQKDCIKCPYFTAQYNQNQDKIIQCLNCLVFPDQFSIELECNEDAEAFDLDIRNTFNRQKREQNKIEYFQIVQPIKGQFNLQKKIIRIQSEASFCKIGQYFSDDGYCRTCGLNCEKCKNENKCDQCVLGFYLNQNYNCVKCENNCHTCELKNQQILCLTCLDQHYFTQNQQCNSCGQFCAKCDSKGYCNYCKNQQKYFISLDGINCLPCNVQNCKFCYQIKKLDNIAFSTFEIHLMNEKPEISEDDFLQTQCAKCEYGYTLDSANNICLKLQSVNDDCLFGKSSQGLFVCLSNQFVLSRNDCNQFSYCEFCTLDQCISCQNGFYLNVQFGNCYPCRQNCKNCKQWNIKFNDYWKQEIIPFFLYLQSNNLVSHKYQQVLYSELSSDLKIICFECEPNYILQNAFQNITDNGQCIIGCQDDCEQCEIIGFQATCIRCKPSVYGQIRSLNSQGQCLNCPKYCSACYEMEIENLILKNQYFIANDLNINYLNRCYEKQYVDNGFVYLNTQFNSAINCQNYEKCYKKLNFEWNIGCDSQQNSQVKNYHNIDEFFAQSIINQLETEQIFSYLNELSVTEINYNLNLIQGDSSACKFPQNAQFKQKFYRNIFSLQNVNLRIVGKGELTKLSETHLHIFDFTGVEFINLQFTSTTILQLNNTFINQIVFKDCTLKPFIDFTQLNFQVVSSNSYSLFLNNFTMENCVQLNSTMLSFQIQNQENSILFISIIDLKVLSTKFKNSRVITMDANSTKNELVIKFTNISFQKSTFINSTFLNSKGNQFVNFEIQNLNLGQFTLISSSLFQIQNAMALIFNTGLIQFGQLQESSNIILANQFTCLNYQFINIQIMNSTIFTNNFNDAPTIINLQQVQTITIFNILFDQIIYNTGLPILEQEQYKKINYFVNVTKLKMTQIQLKLDNLSNFEDQSIIYMACSVCVLDQIEIVREFGISEFRIFSSGKIMISNSIFTQNKEKVKKVIHTSQACYQQYQQDFMQQFILIYNYKNILIQNIKVHQIFTFNHPIISIQGSNIEELQEKASIQISDSQFLENLLIVTFSYKVSIISIINQQYSTIILQNLNFTRNHLNYLINAAQLQIATTILILAEKANIKIQNCDFFSNIITNSTSSVILIQAQTIMILNSNFFQCNVINFKELLKKLVVDESLQQVTSYDLSQIFKIYSNGGCGQFLVQNVTVNNISVNQSSANFGGAFFITTIDDAQIQIINSRFLSAIAFTEPPKTALGGLLFVQAVPFRLDFQMKNCEVEQSFSRLKGVIYVNASATFNMAYFEQIKIIDSGQFLLFQTLKGNEITYITFYQVHSRQSLEGIYKYYSTLYKLAQSDMTLIKYFNAIIQTSNAHLTVQACSFQADINLAIVHMDAVNSAKLIDIYVEFSKFSSYVFQFYLKSRGGSSGNILMQNITVEGLEKFEYQSFGVCLENQVEEQNILMCNSENDKDQTVELLENINVIQKNQLICNLNLAIQANLITQSLIIISYLYEQFSFVARNVNMKSVICDICFSGIIYLQYVRKTQLSNIYFEDITMTNVSSLNGGSITIINQDLSTNTIYSSQLLSRNRVLEFDDQIFKASLNFQVSISNSNFSQNTANFGGAILVAGIDILIQFSKFQQNSADIGGAVYAFNYAGSTAYFYKCLFLKNSAQIAGGIFLSSQNLQNDQNLGTIFLDNNSTRYGNDFLEIPVSLALFFQEGNKIIPKKIFLSSSQSIMEYAVIQPYTIFTGQEKVEILTFPSGQQIGSYAFVIVNNFETISSKFSFRVIAINSENQRQNNLQNSNCSISIKVMNRTSQKEVPNLSANLSYYEALFNTTSGDYNLDDLIIEFNPYYEQEIVLRIFISSDAIKVPIFDKEHSYKIKNYITNYSLFVDVKTFPCQLGEYFSSTNSACYQCDVKQFKYQVKLNSTTCQFKDEQKINQITSSMIQLKQYYWRAYYYSSKIEYCYHFVENCLGGWISGGKSCFIGHIGALCEQCDLYNVRGNGSFSVSSSYKCGSCEQIQGNIISLIFINLWTLISILLSVNSQMLTIAKFIANRILSKLNIHCILKDSPTAVLIKIFTNYIQIISTLSTFQLEIPEGLTGIFKALSSPFEQMAYSLDCFLISFSGIEIIYFRVIWSLILACITVLSCLIILLLGIMLKQIRYDITQISSMLIYMFIYSQPNIIQSISSLASYRLISEVQWVQGNVAYRYDTQSHQFWLIWFCLPTFAIFAVLIPISLFYGAFRNRKKLDKIQIRKVFGYLYNEYKFEAYYWEFIKLIQKVCMAIVLSFYEDYIAIKASIIFLFIFAYSYLTTSKSPYLTGELNKLDFQSIIVCAISIILASSIYLAQQNQLQEIIWSFYTIIAVLNCILFIKIVLKIVMAYFQKSSAFIEKAKVYIVPKLKVTFPGFPQLSKFFESNQMIEQRVKKRFAKIRNYLIPEARKIIKLKSHFRVLDQTGL